MSNGLGRGLSSLIPDKNQKPAVDLNAGKPEQGKGKVLGSSKDEGQELVYKVDVNLIDPNPMQPRSTFSHGPMEDLVNSIKEHGILEPLIATKESDGRYQLIAGERRLRAAKIAEFDTVPVILRTAKELERLELSLIENIQRHDLNPIEVGESYAKLVDEFGMTQEELSKRVGKSRSAVANNLRLLSLPNEIQKALGDGAITEGHARMLLTIEGQGKQMTAFKRIVEGGLTVAEAGNEVRKISRKKFTRRASNSDPNIVEKENKMQEALGTRVKIKKKGEQGKIEVDFYSEEELNGIVNAITNKHESEH
ncbi:ParB/RepB/Spo0J family partition protein [Candidatus Falkowbacteria bacterium]|nr:ParB/RepB/Spo0J family partition protein [Candidatus Falkowbacteria bacterium]